MDGLNVMNGIVLAAELAILAGQLILTWKMHREISRDLGYFSIKSNLVVAAEIKKQFTNYHDLKEGLTFVAKGDSLLCVCGTELSVDGRVKDANDIPVKTFFEPNSEFSNLSVSLDLNERELVKDKIEVVYTLYLQNQRQYKYKQEFRMIFVKNKDRNPNWWSLNGYNFDITKGH